jgi:hypothetical protein
VDEQVILITPPGFGPPMTRSNRVSNTMRRDVGALWHECDTLSR